MAKAISGHSGTKSGVAMAIAAIPVAPPLFNSITKVNVYIYHFFSFLTCHISSVVVRTSTAKTKTKQNSGLERFRKPRPRYRGLHLYTPTASVIGWSLI